MAPLCAFFLLFFFFHLLLHMQVAGCVLFGDTVGGKGKVNDSVDSRPNDRWALENLKGKMSKGQTQNQT